MNACSLHCMSGYIHTYIHTHIDACLPIYKCIYIHTTYLYACTHTYMFAYIYTYLHAYMHSLICHTGVVSRTIKFFICALSIYLQMTEATNKHTIYHYWWTLICREGHTVYTLDNKAKHFISYSILINIPSEIKHISYYDFITFITVKKEIFTLGSEHSPWANRCILIEI